MCCEEEVRCKVNVLVLLPEGASYDHDEHQVSSPL